MKVRDERPVRSEHGIELQRAVVGGQRRAALVARGVSVAEQQLRIGIAGLTPSATMEWSVLLKAADEALYAAKANGRNQSVLASVPKLSLVA